MSRRRSLPFLALLAAACQGPPQEALAPDRDQAARTIETEPAAEPDTTGIAVLDWLEDEQYRATWEVWPGTAPLHPGAEPHGAFLTTYVNSVAFDALERAVTAMPPGSVVVLENYLPDSTLVERTVMMKTEGYDPEHQDWFFARFGSAGEIEAAGRLEVCQGCHVGEPDFLFSGELGTPLPIDSTGGSAPADEF